MPSLSRIRRDAVFRVAAVLVSLVLSGAPRLGTAVLPEPEHRCQCASHGERHRCACPICARKARLIARKARLQDMEELPPCHREAALRELAEEEREVSEAPCVSPLCGGEQAQALLPSLGDPFAVPELLRIPGTGRSGPLHTVDPAPRRMPLRPETPPPRT